ncbi:MAG TPA: HEAT repeat domain-containing protein [Opitutaceae bacterium]|nr:HEAT repeat domain-containing protein [Opitutaceae bacterium]
MSRTLRRFFHLEAGEGAKLLPFALLGLVLQAGLTLGTNGADSAFLVVAGAGRLPHIYLALPVIMLGYVPLYSAAMTRWGMGRVVNGTLAFLCAGGVALWWLLHGRGDAVPLPLCYAAKLWAALWYVGLYTLYWNFVDNYFNLADAKRVFSLLAAGSAVGAILGGSLAGPLAARGGVSILFLAWALAAILAWPLVRSIRRRWPELGASDEEQAAAAEEPKTGLLRLLLHTRYALVLMLVLFFTVVAATVCEFQYLGILSNGRSEEALSALLGHLSAGVNVFNLLIGLLVFNRLVARIGVRNVALLQSSAYALVFSWLLLDGGQAAAIAGFFAYQGLMTSIDFNNANLLFAGLPAHRNQQLRTLIEGFAEPLAVAAAGGFLLLAAAGLSPEHISFAGVLIALLTLALVFLLRYDYLSAIGTNLRRGWLDLALPADPLLSAAAPADLERAEALAATAAPAEAALALRILWLNDPVRGGRALLAFLRRAPAGGLEAVRGLLDAAFSRPGAELPHEIQRWLAEPGTRPDPDLAGELGRHHLISARQTEALLKESAPEARGAAAVALWQSWRSADNREALRQIERLLSSTDSAAVVGGLRALGRLGEPRYAYRLRDFLRSPEAEVRRAALAALREMADPSTRVLLPELLHALPRVQGSDRLAALEAFERIGDSAELAALLEAADHFTPSERRQVERLTVRLGAGTVPILVRVAQSRRSPIAARSIALRALGKVASPQLRLLIEPIVRQMAERSYLFLSGYLALAREGAEANAEVGHAVQLRIFREYPAVALALILESLTLAGALADYETLVVALRSGPSKDRGYAIEAIEQACSPGLFALLLPLLDGRPVEAQVDFAFGRQLIPRLGAAQVIDRTFETGAALACAAAAQSVFAAGGPGAPARLLARLSKYPHPLLAGTVATLLARHAGRGGSEPTPVERVHAFMESPAFAGCSFAHHEFLAPRIRLVEAEPGTILASRGSRLSGAWLLRSGAVQGDAGEVLGPGSVVGAEALHAARRSTVDLLARDPIQALFLPAEAWHACLEVFPELSLSLLARKVAA